MNIETLEKYYEFVTNTAALRYAQNAYIYEPTKERKEEVEKWQKIIDQVIFDEIEINVNEKNNWTSLFSPRD